MTGCWCWMMWRSSFLRRGNESEIKRQNLKFEISEMIIAETKRLILRELTPGDARSLFSMYSDPQVMRFMGPPPDSVEMERRGIEAHIENSYRRYGFGLWAVIHKDTDEVIGRCGLLRFEFDAKPLTEISYLLSCHHWGMGYATEAGAEVVRVAFDDLGIDKLLAMILPSNIASARVAERLGFRVEGAIEYKQFGVVDLYAKHRVESDDQ
jgi:ribosomal-protein-alanine N-acetyltransferase